MGLPEDRSDNVGRARRIDEWWRATRGDSGRTVLDVGSGLAVFPARMKEAGWAATALDPDPRAAEHARSHVGVDAIEADFMTVEPERRFGLVTLNKVLEHVADPEAMLARTLPFVDSGGAVYVEVPDGECAAVDGPGREEFFFEHLHAFSMSSLSLLADHAGFVTRRIERLQEPSTKYTLFAFLEPR
jgi:SAM-dependent methyltransferase